VFLDIVEDCEFCVENLYRKSRSSRFYQKKIKIKRDLDTSYLALPIRYNILALLAKIFTNNANK